MDSFLEREDGRLMFKAKTVRFFKIILDDTIRDGKLFIPRRFVRKYGNDLSTEVVLKVPNGAKWQVELVKCNGEIWLQKGWQQFLNYYSLLPGSFLVFEYDQRKCYFNVIIFDKSASEINYQLEIINGENESGDSDEILSHFLSRRIKKKSSSPFSPPNKKIKLDSSTSTRQVKEKRGSISSHKQTLDEALVRTQPFTAEEKAKALDTTNDSFKSKTPFFMILMQPTYIHLGKLAIPASFVKQYFNKQRGNVILSTVEGKTWSVVYNSNVSNGKASASMSYGWKVFTEENHLKVGDVCVFELINRVKTSFKVVIFRHNKDASIGKSRKLKQEKSCSNRQFTPRNACSKIPPAVEAANKFTSTNPFFKLNIQPSSHHNVTVPIRFLAKFFKKSVENATLEVESRRWPVKLINSSSTSNKAKLSAGWSLFAKENSLRVGDVCIVELINSEPVLLKVYIFRN